MAEQLFNLNLFARWRQPVQPVQESWCDRLSGRGTVSPAESFASADSGQDLHTRLGQLGQVWKTNWKLVLVCIFVGIVLANAVEMPVLVRLGVLRILPAGPQLPPAPAPRPPSPAPGPQPAPGPVTPSPGPAPKPPAPAPPALKCRPMDNPGSDWIFDVVPADTDVHSCYDQNGKVNNQGSVPQMCEGQPNSVFLKTTPGTPDCVVAKSPCRLLLPKLESIDANFEVHDCLGMWIAPLWMTPTHWVAPNYLSGEVDILESCPRDRLGTNFASGGHQVGYSKDEFGLNEISDGHLTFRLLPDGQVFVSVCHQKDLDETGQCPRKAGDASYDNLFASHACGDTSDCREHLVSDIWNGVGGDDGYQHCMNEVDGVADFLKPNLNSKCHFAVTDIQVRGTDAGVIDNAAEVPQCRSLLHHTTLLAPKNSDEVRETFLV